MYQEYYKRREELASRQTDDLMRIEQSGKDRGYTFMENRIDFDISQFWFKVEHINGIGRIYDYCFACNTLDDLKEAIRWILGDTVFTEVTAFVEGCSFVSFRSAKTLDKGFKHYYGV